MFRQAQLFCLIAIGAAVFGNAVWQKLRTGRSSFRLPPANELTNLITDILFWISVAVWVAVASIWASETGESSLLLPISASPNVTAQWIGLFSALIGSALLVTGVFSLGTAFRTSVDYNEMTDLVTTGAYSFCRNPVALGLILNGWATAIFSQTLLAVAAAAALQATYRLRIHFEEKRLDSILGEQYRSYCVRVGRFFPKVTRRK